MVASNTQSNSVRLDKAEAELLDLIRTGELMNWICDRAANLHSADEFLRDTCRTLGGLQRKGLVTGFLATNTGGQMLPIVSNISVTSAASV